MRAQWDELAENYSATREWSRVDSKILDMLKSNPPGRILEIGFGPALVAEKIIDEIPGVEYFGLDVSQNFCHSAKKKLGDAVNLLVSDIQNPGLKGNRFDTILEMAAIHHFHRELIPGVVKTIASLLKSKGRFILAEDWGFDPENEREKLSLEIRRRKDALEDDTEYHPRDDEWINMFGEAEIEVVRHFHVPRSMRLEFFEDIKNTEYGGKYLRLRKLWEGADPTTRMTIFECVKP